VQEANWAFGGYTACYLGVGIGILEWVKTYLRTRTGKGYAQPMGYAPELSHRVGEMETDLEAARLLVYRAAWDCDTHGPTLHAFQWFLRAKLAVGQALQRLCNHAPLACGVHALFKDKPLERMLRDAATASIMPPNSDACATMLGLLSMGLDPHEAPSLKLVGQQQRG
jgi:alkylation response protein AidB-like acyl-CoA dehydrogenase